MRVSTSYQYESHTSRIRENQARMFDAQRQVMTGMRWERASEDPIAAQTVLNARAFRARVEQLDRNLSAAREYLSNTEVVSDELGRLLNTARQSAIRGASSTADGAMREGLAKEIDEAMRRMVDLANSRGTSGNYLFAGQETTTKPFSVVSGALVFDGDDLPINVEVRPGETMRVNIESPDAHFGQIFGAMSRLRDALRTGDLSALGNQVLTDITAAQNLVNQQRADAGIKSNTVKGLAEQNQRRIDDLSGEIADAQEIDMAEAVTNLRLAESVYAASLQVAGRGFELSLMDFLR